MANVFNVLKGSSIKKPRIQETKHLSTDADSSTDAIGGWTENTQKPNFLEKRKKSAKTQKLRDPSGSVVSTMFCKAKSAKKTNFFLRGNFRQLSNKNVQMLDHFFPLLFPKDSESLKIFDIRLQEVGAKRPLNSTSKVNKQTNIRTDSQTDISTYRKHRPKGPMLWKKIVFHLERLSIFMIMTNFIIIF